MPTTLLHGSPHYPATERPVLTIGNFDGVHLGHAALLARVTARARELGAPACVYTFEPPPRRVLQPDTCPPRILSLEDKLTLLGEAGVDQVVVEPFTRELAGRAPEWFAAEILGQRLRPLALITGYDFRFGRGRAGDAALLRQLLPALEIESFGRVSLSLDGQARVASSSAIREWVAQGEVDRAAQVLGRPFSLRGEVVEGDQRGRTLGFPTANLQIEAELLPAAGVYAVQAELPDGSRWPAVANLGVRPTFGGSRFAVEVHLLDFSGDLYHTPLRAHFITRLRPERRFAGVEALRAQIQDDTRRARELLAP